ncbi:MAG: AraC family transcriptional regulator [Myxococcota bacterium]
MAREELLDLIQRHARTDGVARPPFEGVQLFKLTTAVKRIPAVYPASVCVVLQGTKRAYFGGKTHVYGENSLMCCTMPLPIEAEVRRASPEKPVLGVLLSLETPTMMETLGALEALGRHEPPPASAGVVPGLVVAECDAALLLTILRLLELLDDPLAARLLTKARLQELYFALVRGSVGHLIRGTFGASRDLGRALALLRKNLRQPLTVDELAREAGMSRAVFHRKFKAATSLSPLQFVKALRLNDAASLIAGGMNISEAAVEVGYSSPSQFSREFSRKYGVPPRQWANEALGRSAGIPNVPR